MLDSDIEACIQLLNCKPVDTQPMGICFHKRTNIMRTPKVIQHRRAALHQNRWMCFYALFITLNGILFKKLGWEIITYRSDKSIVQDWHCLDRIDCDCECLQKIMGIVWNIQKCVCVCQKRATKNVLGWF